MLGREHLLGLSALARLVLLVPSGAVFYFLAMAVVGRSAVNEVVSLAGHTFGISMNSGAAGDREPVRRGRCHL